MTRGHWFWWVLSMACVVWYSTITIYVSIRGVRDIRGMLGRLARRHARDDDAISGA
jgi:hypothetical protein